MGTKQWCHEIDCANNAIDCLLFIEIHFVTFFSIKNNATGCIQAETLLLY